MPPSNATLTVFKSQADAEAAIRQLAKDGYDLSKVSMLGRDGDGDVQTAGAATAPACPPACPSWDGIRGMLVRSGFLRVPGIGSLVVAGPLLTWIVRSMGPLPGPDKQDAMAVGLHQLGIPDSSVLRCQAALKVGKVVIIAEGSAMMMILAREVFRRLPVEVLEQHLHPPE